ncbi:MAG: TonB-dependent receptor, partial [Sphingobacteriales bacterium]
VTVTSTSQALAIDLDPASILGQEVVVSATRAPERILESPVTVEKLGGVTLRNAPAPSYYEAINNVKGVDMHTASLTFRTVTTRGFVASGNTRFNQLIDGMDNQAPGLNFSVGNIIGPSDLDIDNMEMLSGASSALYGSGGMNGTLLINTKSPFKYQGLSFQVKQGAMHFQDRYQKPTPYYDWSARYGKAWNDKIGFKISAQFIKANDWQAYDEDNVQRTSVVSKVVAGNRTTDPNYDGVNVYGDETSANIGLIPATIREGVLKATGGTVDLNLFGQQYQTNVGSLSPTAMAAFVNGLPAAYNAIKPTLMQFLPLYVAQQSGLLASNLNVSRTGYQERDLVDYNTINFKGTAGLFYKITPRIEASLNSYWGTGTTVYTGADRYSLKNLQMAQHKLEIRHANWFVRGYTTQENSGDSYNATVLGRIMNERFKPSGGSGWYAQYTGAYAQGRLLGQSDFQARTAARAFADAGMPMPGTQAFEDLKNAVASAPIGKDPNVNGAKFLDRSDLWAAEGQLNVSNSLGFTSTVDMIAGVQYKQYVLNSQGTLFADTAGKLKPSEIGGYIQLRKGLFNNVLNLTAAGRYDKHTNFEGRFTPRLTAVIKLFKDNNIRLSYQTAYRFPTNQDQYINLNVGSGLLIGGLESFQNYYNLNSTNPGYTSESVIAARTASDPSKLVAYQYKELKPESVSSYEIGYKGVAAKRFFYDAYAYYSRYKDFLSRVAVVQSLTGTSAGALDPSASASRNLSYAQNTDQEVNALGWGVSAEYNVARSYYIFGNVFSDELRNVPEGYITFFNAPKYRTNLGLRADNVYKTFGFNIVWKWQDANYYEGTFVTGTIPSFHTIDAQVSYRVPNSKSMFRIGATNLANQYYRSGYGSPYVGGLYYASFGYNIF